MWTLLLAPEDPTRMHAYADAGDALAPGADRRLHTRHDPPLARFTASRHSRGPRLELCGCVGQAFTTEAIPECIRGGGIREAESNMRLLGILSATAAANRDAPLAVEILGRQNLRLSFFSFQLCLYQRKSIAPPFNFFTQTHNF
jgi:hypothetical protein